MSQSDRVEALSIASILKQYAFIDRTERNWPDFRSNDGGYQCGIRDAHRPRGESRQAMRQACSDRSLEKPDSSRIMTRNDIQSTRDSSLNRLWKKIKRTAQWQAVLTTGLAVLLLTACQTPSGGAPKPEPELEKPPPVAPASERAPVEQPPALPEPERRQAELPDTPGPNEPPASNDASAAPQPAAGQGRPEEEPQPGSVVQSPGPGEPAGAPGPGPGTVAENLDSSAGTTAGEPEPGGEAREVKTGALGTGRESVPMNSDERFRQAMQRFDQRLERENFDRPSNNPQAGGGGRAGSIGNPFEEEPEDAARPGMVGIDDHPPDGKVEAPQTGRGGIGNPSQYPPPADIPDGRDDDIVARQLREAAENEPDPELRERLWEEYRAYKNEPF
ncbi:MAG: hypothetical protein ABR550_02045 [Wenzhouxiangellaceae bacterium]